MSDILNRFRTKREPEKAGPAPASKAAKRPPYAPVPLEEAANLHRALRGSNGMIVELLFYMVWKTKDRTFPLSNELCARYGVTKWAKRRALARLEKAGLVEIQQTGHRAAVVTLTPK
jgi:hypothetical protein